MRSSVAARRYARRIVPLLLFHLVMVGMVAVRLAGPRPPGAAVAGLLAVLAALPVVALVWATRSYAAEEADAFQRSVQVEALLWAIGVTFGIATAWGVLEGAGLVPRVPSYFAFSVFCIVVASVHLARRLVGGPALGVEPPSTR